MRLGENGVEEVLGLGPLSEYEKQGLETLMPEIKSFDIEGNQVFQPKLRTD